MIWFNSIDHFSLAVVRKIYNCSCVESTCQASISFVSPTSFLIKLGATKALRKISFQKILNSLRLAWCLPRDHCRVKFRNQFKKLVGSFTMLSRHSLTPVPKWELCQSPWEFWGFIGSYNLTMTRLSDIPPEYTW